MVVNTIHWFRKGLRLHDNPSLRDSIRGADTLRCIYILDPWFAGSSNVGINRWRFLLQCLEDLDASLRKLNSRLFVIRGQPTDVFPRLFKEWKITRLSYEYDSEPFGKERDAAIQKLASEAKVEVIVRISHTLYDLARIIELNNGQPPLTYKRFQALITRMDAVELPAETITQQTIKNCATPIRDDHDDKFGVPTLEELGFETEGLSTAVWPGGETEALIRLERHLERTAWVANFERPRMNANSLLASPTGVTPYLRFGCLSCRLFYHKLTDLYRKVFEELLIDADWSVNAGSWMWLSCSSFFQQFFNCCCPVGFGRQMDPNGDYIRRYLPILRGFPARYIYDPWNAPEEVQKVEKCIIGVHYPKPMVNHAEASRINIERMKQIYQQLSCYRGLGLLASVPANSSSNMRGVGAGTGPGSGRTSEKNPTQEGTRQTAERGQTTLKRRREEAAPESSCKTMKQSK
ncbi:cryptochrome-1b isoform X3 [Cheilinus undulatus]|uniref:cryptochrome-1b isoform X3 n=1 Tax=Cheilinus undulatus TaxID=241271 RepID=UPI001BD1E3E5|nr:cryptochrome-1b isoform X3 [Cheilinus undulatus]